jgi:flagellar protein FlbT
MALKLTLKPGEKFVINGAVVVNGDRRAHLLIQNNVAILREKDVMQQQDAKTPVRRIYFAIQMLYLDESNEGVYFSEFTRRLKEFMGVLSDREALARCGSILEEVSAKHYYRALMSCKKLMPFEETRLNFVSAPESAAAEPNQVAA